MRAWPSDHPRASLLARKQAAILDAARREFLEKGFGDTTMAGVAATAGVSVATVYRHVRSKEELFEAVVGNQHDPEEVAAGLAQLERLPLREAMMLVGEGLLQMVLSPQSVAMHRMVIAEAERFPHLGPIVFKAILGHGTDAVAGILAPRIGPKAAADAAPRFMSGVLGDRLIRALLGFSGPEDKDECRANVAAVIDSLGLSG